jgi:hypothetical protein
VAAARTQEAPPRQRKYCFQSFGRDASGYVRQDPVGVARLCALVEETYSSASTARLDAVDAGTDPFALPRVDAHYVRRPDILRRVLAGELGAYLWARRVGARARRAVVKDYAA